MSPEEEASAMADHQSLTQENADSIAQLEERNRSLAVINEELQLTFEELKAAEEELHERNQSLVAERQRYQDLFNFAPDGYLVTDQVGVIQEANHAIVTLLSVDLKFLIGKPLNVFIAHSDRRAFYQQLNRLPALEQIQNWELQVQPRQGDAIPVEVTVTCIRSAFGTIEGLRWLIRDIRDRKQTEAQLLEQERAAREAENANRLKDEFLAVLSHELRSPLNPILGWVKLLQTRKFDQAKTTEALATIERNAQLQAKLIEDLLDVSRILRDKLTLKLTPINLEYCILAALDTVRLAAQAKEVDIQTVFDPTVEVMGDPTRLQQVIWNLLSNAVKFTPEGGRIEVRLRRTDTHAQIQVMDTGKGIGADFLPSVFDYFRQEDGSTTRTFGGLGLGLAIVRQIVDLHGGTVEADSRGDGQGATFTICLPLTENSASSVEGLQPTASLSLQGMNVLIVDDDTDSRDLITFVLEQSGASVTSVTSAEEVLQTLAQTPHQVLVSDVGMPEMDGYELMRQVRTLPPQQGGEIPAIAVTAYAGDINQQQALSVGFQWHLSKPVDSDELVVAVARLGKPDLSGESQSFRTGIRLTLLPVYQPNTDS
ncbi:PAS domain S-box protein [Phormidesmis priestleyi ULC007]|uniref:Circadian input-output histidine kinase CikA n=1 Tax=Phormidesmis priestleyi ULC007 TaxID=1920490 RepID=A0A2T1DAH7_9CYAN|nr:ATP-binding protein [Phormidesmis priestleyi]PSB17518.1 PAS domain S-box protein [Phormidesmis priestleyi ULC007]PZO47253.1 MAG: PAS domain S-box protein [Phormidesmis priestleyi]